MTYDAFAAEVTKAVATLDALRRIPCADFGDGYKHIGANISLMACDCAAQITGFDPTFCRMLNHKFRADAATLILESIARRPAAEREVSAANRGRPP